MSNSEHELMAFFKGLPGVVQENIFRSAFFGHKDFHEEERQRLRKAIKKGLNIREDGFVVATIDSLSRQFRILVELNHYSNEEGWRMMALKEVIEKAGYEIYDSDENHPYDYVMYEIKKKW